jgi:Werner syndrome ATP-dependent helicase
MATASGKSLCYQFPSLFLNKLTVVISPLISLMEDQVMALKLVNIEACLMGSAQDQRDETNEKIFNGKCKILYLTPEFLQENVSFLEKINDTIGRLKFYL